jgi:hypothetical protein
MAFWSVYAKCWQDMTQRETAAKIRCAEITIIRVDMFNFLLQGMTQLLRFNELASPDISFVSLVLPLQIQLQRQILGTNGTNSSTIARGVGSNQFPRNHINTEIIANN